MCQQSNLLNDRNYIGASYLKCPRNSKNKILRHELREIEFQENK